MKITEKTKQILQELFIRWWTKELGWKGDCHDCGVDTEVIAMVEDDGKLTISGGAVAFPDGIDGEYFVKCESCFDKDNFLRNFRECEVFSRIVGYLRPLKQWNVGKKAEFENRKLFKTDGYK